MNTLLFQTDMNIGETPFGYNAVENMRVDFSTHGEVNLLVYASVNNLPTNVTWWDGTNFTPNGAVDGGSGSWNNSATNWTTAEGTANSVWTGEVAAFSGTGGTVTLTDNVLNRGMVFLVDGYTIEGNGHQVGITNRENIFSVSPDITATINAPIVGGGGFEKTGGGRLVLAQDNTYIGTTTISAGTLQLGNDGTTGSVLGHITNNGILSFNHGTDITFSNGVSGSGTVVKNLGNTLTLVGDYSHTGGTIINAGTLQLGDGAQGIVFQGNVTNNASLAFNTPGNFTYGGTVTGAGSLTKKGSSTLSLTGANTYSGGTVIESGNLRVGDGSTSGSIAGNVSIAALGRLTFDRFDDVLFAGNISGDGMVFKMGENTLTLSGTNSYSGGTVVNAGTLAGTVSSLQGNISVSDFAVVRFEDLSDSTFTGRISGAGGLTRRGSGSLALAQNQTYSGSTLIESGGLDLAGFSLASTQVTVEANGSLTGPGSIAGNLTNHGLVSPAGTLNVGGDYTQSATGTLLVGISSDSVFDRLLIGGRAALDGVLKVVFFGGYSPGDNLTFKIIEAIGGVSGQFSASDMSSRLTAQYNSNDVTLVTGGPAPTPTPTPAPTPSPTPEPTPAPSPTPGPSPKPDGKTDKPSSEEKAVEAVQIALEEILAPFFSPTLTALKQIEFSNAQVLSGSLDARMAAIRNGSRGFATYGLGDLPISADSLHPLPERGGLWASATGIYAGVQSVSDLPRYNFASGQFLVGTDCRFSDSFAVGGFLGFVTTYAEITGGSNLSANGGRVGLYGTYQSGGFYLNGQAAAGLDVFSVNRSMPGATAHSNPQAFTFQTSVLAGYDHQFGRLTLGAFAGAQFTELYVPASTENGAGVWSAGVGEQSASSLRSTIGAKGSYKIQPSKQWRVEPFGSLAWQHEFMDRGYSVGVSLDSGKGPSFPVAVPAGDRDAIVGTIGVSTTYRDRLTAYGLVGVSASKNVTAGFGQVGFSVAW